MDDLEVPLLQETGILQLHSHYRTAARRAATPQAEVIRKTTLKLGVTNLLFFPKQCGHTDGILTVRKKGPVGPPFFPVNYRKKWLF